MTDLARATVAVAGIRSTYIHQRLDAYSLQPEVLEIKHCE